MKRLNLRLLMPLMFAITSAAAYAASDSTSIDLQVTHIEYLNFIGTAVGINKTIAVDDIRNGNVINIGTLGLESTLTGSCTLDFSSLNGFSLKHSQGNQRLSDYQLTYVGNTIASNTTIILPSCDTTATALDFLAIGKIKKNPRPGLYSDTVTIIVTSQ